MPMATVNGAELYHEVRGDGPPVLLVTGATGDGGHFDALANLLADEFTVISYSNLDPVGRWLLRDEAGSAALMCGRCCFRRESGRPLGVDETIGARPERARDRRRHWLPLAEAKQAPPRPAFCAEQDLQADLADLAKERPDGLRQLVRVVVVWGVGAWRARDLGVEPLRAGRPPGVRGGVRCR